MLSWIQSEPYDIDIFVEERYQNFIEYEAMAFMRLVELHLTIFGRFADIVCIV